MMPMWQRSAHPYQESVPGLVEQYNNVFWKIFLYLQMVQREQDRLEQQNNTAAKKFTNITNIISNTEGMQ